MGKTAYVLVDALRFEMARELMASLQNEYAAELTVAVGTMPTITELGMAALMPGTEGGVTIVPTAEGKLGLRVAEAILKDRKSRVDWFCSQLQGPVAVATMENVLPKPKRPLQNEMQAARVILVTSQEIDALCESDNIHLARKAMDDVLPEISRLVNRLRDVGCTTIVVTADHGYLFGDELDTDMKIDPPGGQTVDLHRRVWVGRGGSNDPAYLRVALSRLGLSDDLELAVPWGFAVFKVQGGARAYFHGGLSPQEMAVPVMVLTPLAAVPTASPAAMSWELVPGSKKISTRFFSVQITGQATGLFGLEPTRMRVEVRSTDRSNKGQVLSVPVSASYGFIEATGDVEVRMKGDESQTVDPNTVTLMIATPAEKAVVAVCLLDAVTGRELAVLPQVDMIIAL